MHCKQQNSQGIPSHRPRILRCSLVKNSHVECSCSHCLLCKLTGISTLLFSFPWMPKRTFLALITFLKPKHHHYQDNDLFAWKKISCKHSATSKTCKPCTCPPWSYGFSQLPWGWLAIPSTPLLVLAPVSPCACRRPIATPRFWWLWGSRCATGPLLQPSHCGTWHCSFPPVPYEGKVPDFAVSHSLCFHQQTVTHLLYLPRLPFLFFL